MASINETKPEISVIIISYNTLQLTKDCITSIFESLQGSNRTLEVIVVDNNSTDGSIEELHRLQKLYPQIRIIANNQNAGFGAANNQGVAIAQAKTILLLNSDTIVLNSAIEKLYHAFQTNSYACMGAKLFNQDMSEQPSAGVFFHPLAVFAFLFLKGDAIGLTRRSPNQITATDWVSGACIMTTKKVYQELGGFDEQIFMYMEEVDLLYRAHQKGYTTGFTPDARFIHLGSGSSSKSYPILQVYRGLWYFYQKHYSKAYLWMLKSMLQLKAMVSYIIGRLTGNTYLIKTYGEAYRIATMA